MTSGEKLLVSAMHALRSYQHGNVSPELAEEIADAIEQYLPSVTSEDTTRANQGTMNRSCDPASCHPGTPFTQPTV